jgi:hypothetical protein
LLTLLPSCSFLLSSPFSVDQFEHLSGYREKLRELLVTNNPFFVAFTASPGAAPQTATQLDYTVYQQYISSIFPSLKLLDGLTLQSLIDFDLPTALSTASQTSLPPLKDSYFDSTQHQKMCFAFVQRYFELYDGNRQNRDLISVYADNAMFSLSYQTEPQYPNVKYTEQNRNIGALGLAKLRGPSEKDLLKTTPVAIVSALHSLPSSKHDVNSFVADVVKVASGSAQLNAAGGLLSVTIRGQFLEGGATTQDMGPRDAESSWSFLTPRLACFRLQIRTFFVASIVPSSVRVPPMMRARRIGLSASYTTVSTSAPVS